MARSALGILLICCGFACIACEKRSAQGSIPTGGEFSQRARASPAIHASSEPEREGQTPEEDICVLPLAILQNPFLHRGRIITLDAKPTNIPQPGGNFSWEEVRFSRVISEDTVLFDVFKLDWSIHKSSYDIPYGNSPYTYGQLGMPNFMVPKYVDLERAESFMGQIAFKVSSPQEVRFSHETYWRIEPLGVMEGTNGMGAPIQVPLVRFIGYRADRPPYSRDTLEAYGWSSEPSRVSASGPTALGKPEFQAEPNEPSVTPLVPIPSAKPEYSREGRQAETGPNNPTVTPPVVISKREAQYSQEARQAKVEGTVALQFVVDAEGNVGEPKVEKSLGYGLDEKAIEAVKTWKFKPATRNGVPTPVRVRAEVNFQLY